MIELIDTGTIAGLRDCALLLLGFAAALRRSELVELDAEDLCFDLVRGPLVTVRRSKTDQHGHGELVAVPYAQDPDRCAVRSVRLYLDVTGIHHGPVFRQMRRGDTLTDRRLSDQSVALIVKRRAEAAGVSAALLSGHSLRAGYATAAAAVFIHHRGRASPRPVWRRSPAVWTIRSPLSQSRRRQIRAVAVKRLQKLSVSRVRIEH